VPRRSVLGGLIVGVLLSAGLATASSDARPPATGQELYNRIVAAAASGDARAQEQLTAIDTFLQQRRIGADALTVPAGGRASEAMGLVQLSLDDRGPWRIGVSNTTRFASATAVMAYRAARHAALDALAAEDPHREIRVAITPDGPRAVEEIASILPATALGERLIVDVFTPDGWLMATGYDISGRGVKADAAAVATEVIDLAAASIDLFPGVDRRELRTSVRTMYVVMPAASAVDATSHRSIFAVDPLADIEDTYAGRAAIVDVESAPDLREAHARLVLGRPIDENIVSPRKGDGR